MKGHSLRRHGIDKLLTFVKGIHRYILFFGLKPKLNCADHFSFIIHFIYLLLVKIFARLQAVPNMYARYNITMFA